MFLPIFREPVIPYPARDSHDRQVQPSKYAGLYAVPVFMSYKFRADVSRMHKYEMPETHAFIRFPFVELSTVDFMSELAFAGYDKSENILWKFPDIRYNLLEVIHLISVLVIGYSRNMRRSGYSTV
jgi:hypothetical protein